MKKSRSPLQVSPEFKKRLDELQRKVTMARNGEKPSLREITEEIIKSPVFNDLENDLLKTGRNIKMDIKIKLDGRKFR